MIEFQYNGYNVRILGDIINISLDNDLILVYSDQHGEQIYGHRTPTRIVEVREVLQHVREQASME
jgi:hypothetical protein